MNLKAETKYNVGDTLHYKASSTISLCCESEPNYIIKDVVLGIYIRWWPDRACTIYYNFANELLKEEDIFSSHKDANESIIDQRPLFISDLKENTKREIEDIINSVKEKENEQ